MEIAFFVGRVVFAIYWLESAYNHLFHTGHMIGYAAAKGVKAPALAIRGSGLLLLLGGLSILLGVYTTVGMILITIFLLGVSFKMHAYWKETDQMARMNDRIQFWKNIALLASLLMMLAIPQPWFWSF